MNLVKLLKPRLKHWYWWHTNYTSMFDDNKNKFAAPIIAALVGAAIAGMICVANTWFWLLIPAVLIAALIGGAIGDLAYLLVLVGDIAIERELSARVKAIEKALVETEAIVNHNAPQMDSARRYFARLRTKLSRLNNTWYDEGIGIWCDRVIETGGCEMAVLVHILNKVHRMKQPDWKSLDVARDEQNRSHCHHPSGHHRPHWCSFCYEDVFRQLATPLLQAISPKV